MRTNGERRRLTEALLSKSSNFQSVPAHSNRPKESIAQSPVDRSQKFRLSFKASRWTNFDRCTVQIEQYLQVAAYVTLRRFSFGTAMMDAPLYSTHIDWTCHSQISCNPSLALRSCCVTALYYQSFSIRA